MSSMPLRFLLNQEEVALEQIDPNTTVLQYLRNHRQKVGTKEGCASGDCGACTVVVAEVVGDRLKYKSVNACITLLISLHGKQLITVEGLKQQKGNGKSQLHFVQQSLVNSHGSQCGFCTPGFVMSLFALHKHKNKPNREEVLHALGGNLCRCTGYRSIIDAALEVSPAQDHFDRNSGETIDKIHALNASYTAKIEHQTQRAFAPQSIEEFARLLSEFPQAHIVAGGTDFSLQITQELKQFEVLISSLDVAELQQVAVTESNIRIGAAASYNDFSDMLTEHYPEWGAMIERLGSKQVRNIGTLGGNIANASPIGDMPPVLIALNAQLRLRSGDQVRTMPIEAFFLDYKTTALAKGEFIESIEIPLPKKEGEELKVYKISKRFDDDISAVLMAINISLQGGIVEEIKIACGGMAAVPKRAISAESALSHQPLSMATINQAQLALKNDFAPISDIRASSDYRMQVAQNLLERAFYELTQSVRAQIKPFTDEVAYV